MSNQENRQATSEGKHNRPGRRRRSSDQVSPAEKSINMDELRDLIKLIRENGLAEFELERTGFRVRLRRDQVTGEVSRAGELPSVSQPAPLVGVTNPEPALKSAATLTPSHPGAEAETAASADQDLHIVTSPIVGTFYRASSPNAEPFVKIGSHVEPDSLVCIIEAMKLMNEIQAETTGEIAKIYVENGQPVEYGQPLFGVKN